MDSLSDRLDNIADPEELMDIKHQLLKESVRIQAERTQIEADLDELHGNVKR